MRDDSDGGLTRVERIIDALHDKQQDEDQTAAEKEKDLCVTNMKITND